MARVIRMAIAFVFCLTAWSAILWLCDNNTLCEPLSSDALYPGICLDPGHGGPDACKWSPPCSNGDGHGSYGPGPDSLTEAWVNHEIVPMAGYFLEGETYVRYTKTEITQYRSLKDRYDIANNDPDVDVFISVHHEGDIRVSDTRVFYMDAPGIPNPETGEWRYKLALGLANEINRRFQYGMQVKPDTDAGAETLAVLRNTWMPAALTEASCIKHESEEYLMANDYWHRQDEALGISDGFFAYADTFTCPQNFNCCCDDDPEEDYVYFWWNPVEGADGYVLYQDLYDCPPTPESGWINVYDVTLWSWPKFMVGYWDCFAVQAYVTGYGGTRFVGGLSNHKYGHECCATGIDRWISNFTATGGNHQITLDWRAVSFEDWAGFEIWRSTNGGQYYGDSCIGYVPFDYLQEDYSIVDTTTQYRMTYYYKIRDTEGYDWWGPASAKPDGVPVPPLPSPAPDLAISHLGDRHMHLCLEQGSQYADYYLVQWRPEGGAWADTTHQGEKCTEWLDLANGTTYCFKACAVNGEGQTDFSTQVCGMPMLPPSNLHSEPDHQSIHLWWDGNALASGYLVYYSAHQFDPWDPWGRDSLNVGDTTATTLTGLENGVMYYACVVGLDQFSNETEPTNLVSARPECWAAVAGGSDPAGGFALGKSYPNPFDVSAVIPYRLAKPCTQVRLVIYDAVGREVRRLLDESRAAGCYQAVWDGRDRQGRSVPPGVYFYRIDAGGFSQTNKLLLVK